MMAMTRLRLSASTCNAHFGADLLERLHLEVGVAHPELDGAEPMLNGLAPLAHLLRMLFEPLLDGLENILVFPAGDPAPGGRSATSLPRCTGVALQTAARLNPVEGALNIELQQNRG